MGGGGKIQPVGKFLDSHTAVLLEQVEDLEVGVVEFHFLSGER